MTPLNDLAANLVHEWLPALVGVTAKLEAGAAGAAVGRGHDSLTLMLADAYPASRFTVATADAFTGGPYDLICLVDCGDPAAALEQCRRQLKADGTVLLVEPFAGDRLGPLGAQAGPHRLIEIAHRAGFTGARVATSTPVNLILELTA